MDGGDVRYATNDGVSIAYQVFGDGPRDLVFVCGTMSHLELWWADPQATRMLHGLSRFCRVILFDKPGTGLSDPVPAAPTIEQRTSDVTAVMDAVGSERAVIVGFSEGGIPAITLAATQPDRVEALVLLSTYASTEWMEDADVPLPVFDKVWAIVEASVADWGAGILMSAFAPTLAGNPVYKRLLGSIERTCMSPAMARSVLLGLHDVDLRESVAAIHVPTLIAHAPETFLDQGLGRDLAKRIPHAVFRELAGPDHLTWVHNSELFPAVLEEFLTGTAHHDRDENRVMTTVVFTDIVDSTKQLARVGDAQWRTIMAAHDRRMDELLDRYDGQHVKHTGDGRMARFARPARALRFALAMADAANEVGLEIRAGVHTGECEVVDADVLGLTVNIAARIAAAAGAGEVLTSSTVRDLVIGTPLVFASRGVHTLKGVPGGWEIVQCRGEATAPTAVTGGGYETDVRHAGPTLPATGQVRVRDRALVFAARRMPGTARRVLRATR